MAVYKENTMKVTKEYLKSLIKEELELALEARWNEDDEYEEEIRAKADLDRRDRMDREEAAKAAKTPKKPVKKLSVKASEKRVARGERPNY